MLNDLVNSFFGSLPNEFQFLKIYGYLFVIYILVVLFTFIIEIIKDFLRSYL